MINYLFYTLNASVYKKTPVARVYIDKLLVDEHEIKKKEKFPIDNNFRVITFFTKYNYLDIKIEIFNQDSNYTNGFMSKSTLVNLSGLYVVTEKVLQNLEHISTNYKFSKQNIDTSLKSILMFYGKIRKKKLIQNFAMNVELDFSSKNLDVPGGVGLPEYNVGGNGTYYIGLRKKLGFWRDNKSDTQGIHNLGHTEQFKILKNKYITNENK